jgi:hypothetical protein
MGEVERRCADVRIKFLQNCKTMITKNKRNFFFPVK